jgi:hypothetical protein
MNIDKITVAGAVLALMTVVLFILIMAQSPFPIFSPLSLGSHFINATGSVGPEDSSFMWTSRTLDLVTQAFVIFAAAAGCLALLRITEKKDDSDA